MTPTRGSSCSLRAPVRQDRARGAMGRSWTAAASGGFAHAAPPRTSRSSSGASRRPRSVVPGAGRRVRERLAVTEDPTRGGVLARCSPTTFEAGPCTGWIVIDDYDEIAASESSVAIRRDARSISRQSSSSSQSRERPTWAQRQRSDILELRQSDLSLTRRRRSAAVGGRARPGTAAASGGRRLARCSLDSSRCSPDASIRTSQRARCRSQEGDRAGLGSTRRAYALRSDCSRELPTVDSRLARSSSGRNAGRGSAHVRSIWAT